MDNIFDFAERHVNEVMIPRTDMVCLYVQDPFEVNLEKALTEQLTRYPVCDPDKDNIIGFVHIKDLLAALSKGQTPALQEIVREVTAVSEAMPISNLLMLLQKNKGQIAIVIDEYGGTAGLVTVEDILEEIVGEIQDEFDEERPFIEVREDHMHSVDGRLLLEEVNDVFGLNIDEKDVDTLGGWVSSQVEMPPRIGQQISYAGTEFVIEEVDNMRITRVLVRTSEVAEPEPQIPE